ncbi:hypothetical protein BaRGS_00032016 [Batillaria attramentaria]|uniref:Uncharacterized protein n=1 Tax=Batillaria attramentaria TaxID=370345 RepID=A0ABD0JNS9_9CAEN
MPGSTVGHCALLDSGHTPAGQTSASSVTLSCQCTPNSNTGRPNVSFVYGVGYTCLTGVRQSGSVEPAYIQHDFNA